MPSRSECKGGWYNCAMNCEVKERNNLKMPEERFFRETGVVRYSLLDGTDIVGLSGNTWEEYLVLLGQVSPTDKFVVSPELITYAGKDFENLSSDREEIGQRIAQVIDFSLGYSETTFVLGTPLFLDQGRPRNSAVLIRNGKIIGETNKRSGATVEESKYFELVAEEPPRLLPGTQTALLICADLPTASLYANCSERLLLESLRLSNRKHLIGKKVELLPSSATSLLVIACWGVGGQWVEPGKEDYYYGMQLRNIAWNLMRGTKIKEVVVVDRSPNDTVKPFNSRVRL